MIEIDARIEPLAKEVNAIVEYEGGEIEGLDWEAANQALIKLLTIAKQEGDSTLNEAWFALHALESIHIIPYRDGNNPNGRYNANILAKRILRGLEEEGMKLENYLTTHRPTIPWEFSINPHIFSYLQKRQAN